MNLWTVFLTGLLTGGLTCLAVQGGLLTATIAQKESSFAKAMEDKEERFKREENILPIILFLGAKLIAYTILGFFLGLLGSVFQLSLTAKIIMQATVGIFMIGTALNLLDVHPIFRYFVIQPPKFLFRLVRNQISRPKADQPLVERSKSVFAPIILGAFTVFIPCGTTQAMMALAIASGSAIYGAAILFAFVLGTSPTFFIIGFLVTKLGNLLRETFMQVAAYAILLLAVFNLNAASALAGSDFTLENLWREIDCTVLTFCDNETMGISSGKVAGASVNEITINIENGGYSPRNITVKKGAKVTLNLVNNSGKGCTQAFTIPKLGIQRVIPLGSSEKIEFTAPARPGDITFVCSMGMFGGRIHVI